MMNGYKHQFGKNIGGIKKILITPVCNIKTTVTNPKDGTYTSIHVINPGEIAECSFAENAASYREDTDNRNGIPSVTHSLELYTDKMDQKSDMFIRSLIEMSKCGLAAVITTNNNVCLVVGYSEEHGRERPLRLKMMNAESGKNLNLYGQEAISLCAKDNAKARILNGTME